MSTKRKQSKKAAPVSREEVKTSQGYYVQPEESEALLPIIETGFWERFEWKDFFCYGALWCIIFFAVTCVFRIGNIIAEQRRQINDLIDRLNQYEDYSPTPPFDKKDNQDSDSDLAFWVKKNLPSSGIEERPAVAAVFGNLADMLDAGTLTGENDTFSEGIAQLQPVATRSVWLPFFTKLTKRLKSAKLDSAGLAAACRTVSQAIYLPLKREGNQFITDAPLLLLEGAKIPLKDNTETKSPENESSESPDSLAELQDNKNNPSLIQNNEPAKTEEPDKKEASDCPNGNCPADNSIYKYYGGYGWRYW